METDLTLLPNGSQLETALLTPSAGTTTNDDERSKLAVLLHPWSVVGGRMDDPRLIFIARFLRDRGHHVLLFNSRGVGKSKGWPSPSGSQESKDLHALIQWAIRTVNNVRKLLIVGYSHGSLIASTHLPLSSSSPDPDNVLNSSCSNIRTSHVFLSYPLGVRSLITLFNGSKYEVALSELSRHPHARILLLYGDEDDFTSIDKYREWEKGVLRNGKSGIDEHGTEYHREGRVRSLCVEGAGHFWAGPQFEPPLRAWLDDFDL